MLRFLLGLFCIVFLFGVNSTAFARESAACQAIRDKRDTLQKICTQVEAKRVGGCQPFKQEIINLDTNLRKNCTIIATYDFEGGKSDLDKCTLPSNNARGSQCPFSTSRSGIEVHSAISQDVYNDAQVLSNDDLGGYKRVDTKLRFTRDKLVCTLNGMDVTVEPYSWKKEIDYGILEYEQANCRLEQVDMGLQVASYQGPNGDIVIGFRGTEGIDFKDWNHANTSFGAWENGFGGYDFKQILDAANAYVKDIQRKYPNSQVSLTGHSMGGAVAQVLSGVTGYDTNTFNSPGVLNVTNDYLTTIPGGGVNSNLDCLNHHTRGNPDDTWDGDLVAKIGTHGGVVTTYPLDDGWVPIIDEHSIDRFNEDLKEGMDPTSTGLSKEDLERIKSDNKCPIILNPMRQNLMEGRPKNGASDEEIEPLSTIKQSSPYVTNKETLPQSVGQQVKYQSDVGFVTHEKKAALFEKNGISAAGYEVVSGFKVDVFDITDGELEFEVNVNASAYAAKAETGDVTLYGDEDTSVSIGAEATVLEAEASGNAEFELSVDEMKGEAEISGSIGFNIAKIEGNAKAAKRFKLPFSDKFVILSNETVGGAAIGAGIEGEAGIELSSNKVVMGMKLGLFLGIGVSLDNIFTISIE